MTKKNRWIDVIIVGILVACVVASIQVYYNQTRAECISEPLVYAAKNIEENTGGKFIGTGTITVNNQAVVHITFDSTGVESDSLE